MIDNVHQTHVLHALDGHKIHVQIWKPADTSLGLIQILHGLGEYSGRYERFANAAVARGFAVCTHDHRGHGGHDEIQGHYADSNGWNLLITDALLVLNYALKQCDKEQAILLGHSMGSYIAQSFTMRYPKAFSTLILSASTSPSRLQLRVAKVLAQIEIWRRGVSTNSPLLDKLGFGDFNKAFLPGRTPYDWLSRDEAEVDKYVASPLCGGPYSCGLWRDLLSGLLEISTTASLQRIPVELPVLIMGGQVDPVGGERGMLQLAEQYKRSAHNRVSLKIYEDGRHEMLNETNREEVTSDLLEWISANYK